METAEQREERLKIMHERQIKKRAAEQREERLQSLQNRQRDRVSRLRINQTERIDMETDNEERSSPSHRFPQLQHSEVQRKMKKFHTHLDSLEINKCTTYLEAFPGLRLSTECQIIHSVV